MTKTMDGRCGCAGDASGPGLPRRRFLAAGGAVATGAMLRAPPARAQTRLSPNAALERLMAGNARFAANRLTSFQEDLDILKAGTVAKQEPFAAVLSCADSRVPVELVFDQSLGHVFVARVAGNVATPEIIATLEYGAAVLGTRGIMVLGHQGCGAVKAAIAGKAVPGQISALYRPLRPAVERGGADVEAVSKANAQIQAGLLATSSPVLADLIKQGALKVVAAYYDLSTGKVAVLG
ncbi:MAG: carbonic anhydrase [Caulobacteraceae bacterium]|nr:carbonic anhydrase [Caulobacteraceae bacterium]